MAISEKDIKKLWGLAAGRCSRPGCEQDCVVLLNPENPTVIGEMAHVIAKQPDGPRGLPEGGDDTYDNLILLCPTHHTEVDKAPESYPENVIRDWKRAHEERVRNSFRSARYPDRRSLARAIRTLLIENKTVWELYGPESQEAKKNPLSNLANVWVLRKLSTLVPNNRRIIHMIEQNRDAIDADDYGSFVKFIEHAEGFERSCYVRTEGVQRFPPAFATIVEKYAEVQ